MLQGKQKEKLKRAIEETAKLDFSKAGQYTVGQWTDVWLENCAKVKVRPSSRQTCRDYIGNHKSYIGGAQLSGEIIETPLKQRIPTAPSPLKKRRKRILINILKN